MKIWYLRTQIEDDKMAVWHCCVIFVDLLWIVSSLVNALVFLGCSQGSFYQDCKSGCWDLMVDCLWKSLIFEETVQSS